MKSDKLWVSALNISPTDYNIWLRELPKNESFTFWCLKTGKIANNDYLNWAQEHFELATLQREFFQNPPNLSLWHKIQTVADWSEKMIPITEWDGVIFIACVEPPLEIQWSFPVSYVLANSHDLMNYWNALQENAKPAEEPLGLQLGQIKSIRPAQDLDPMEKLTREFSQPNSTHPSQTPNDVSFDDVDTNISEAPEGLSLEPLAAPVLKLHKSPEAEEELAATATEIELDIPNPERPRPALQMEPPPPTETIKTQTSTKQVSAYSGFLHQMKNQFQGGMIFSVQGESIKPVAWDENFRRKSEKADGAWSLNSPSAFRIAFRTKLPYLGHIVDTPTNREFFTSWGHDDLPASVLIQPVLQNKKVTHLILALADKDKKTHQLITAGEKLAHEFQLLDTDEEAA